MLRHRLPHWRKYYGSASVLLLIFACAASAKTSAPPSAMPVGTIVAFMPDMASGAYSSTDGLKVWLNARGWAICDGSEETSDLHNRMLLGTERPEEASQKLSSANHNHKFSGETARRSVRETRIRDGIRHPARISDEHQQHKMEGNKEYFARSRSV